MSFTRESHCNLHSSLARHDGEAGPLWRPSATRAYDDAAHGVAYVETRIRYVMVPQDMPAESKGLARLDKGMADDGGLLIVRSFVRNQEDKFVDSDLEENASLLFTVFKILMEEHDFQNVALQKMLTQKIH